MNSLFVFKVAEVLNDCYCFLFQQRKRNLPQTSYVELVLVVDNLRVGVIICLGIHLCVRECSLAATGLVF